MMWTISSTLSMRAWLGPQSHSAWMSGSATIAAIDESKDPMILLVKSIRSKGRLSHNDRLMLEARLFLAGGGRVIIDP